MVAQPVHHSHVVFLIWGKAKFEQHDPLDSLGCLAMGSNGMAIQLQHDMHLLRSLRDEEPFFEEWGRHNYSWRALFSEELVKDEFMRLDMQVFRAVFYTHSAPLVMQALERCRVGADGADEMDVIERPHACTPELGDATQCCARFVTTRVLRLRQTHRADNTGNGAYFIQAL